MKKIIWMLLLAPLTGCFHHTAKENVNTETDASSIDLVEAMRQVGKGLTEMRNAQGGVKTGLIADTATVTFNISADSSYGGKLKVDLSAPIISEGAGIGGEVNSQQESKRSNSVTVTFKNILTIPKDTVGHALATSTATSKEKNGLLKAMEEMDIQIQKQIGADR